MAASWRTRLIRMGAFDRLASIMAGAKNKDGSYVKGQIPTEHYPTYKAALDYMRTLNLPSRQAKDAFHALLDEARKAANAARRWRDKGGDTPSPGLPQLPCPENPGGRCGDRIEYTGWVVVRDPATGVEKRVPFVVRSDDPLTQSGLASLAASAAMRDVTERGYDAGGRIDPARAVVGTVIVGTVVGRG